MKREIPNFIVGADYSMACPALSIINTKLTFNFYNCNFFYLCEKVVNNTLGNVSSERFTEENYNSQEERFDIISDWAIRSIKSIVNQDSVILYLEDYSYNSRGKVFNIAENTGLFKHKLYKNNIPISLVSPSTVKKLARGKGIGSKDQMYEAFLKETNIPLMKMYQPTAEQVGNPVGDLVDSFYICKYGYKERTK